MGQLTPPAPPAQPSNWVTCTYCKRHQLRTPDGGCVGCGAALPAGASTPPQLPLFPPNRVVKG